MEPGNSCRPCQCHGNSVDAHGRDLCDRETGHCLSCTGHTEGRHCERCQSGYYGTAVMGDCQGQYVFWPDECNLQTYNLLDKKVDSANIVFFLHI